MAKFKNGDRVALKSDIKCKGRIFSKLDLYGTDDVIFYTVEWDKDGSYNYMEDVLILEKEIK